MASISKIVKQIKDEVKSEGSSMYFPLSNRELRKMQDQSNSKYLEFINKVIDKLKEDKQLYKLDWKRSRVYSLTDFSKSIITINEIVAIGKPCKEFDSLNNWLKKYANRRLSGLEVKEESIAGKRSTYDVEGVTYLMHDSKKCKSLLEELRKARSTKDTIVLRSDEDIYWGDRFNSYGEDMECEWNGYKTYMVKFIIKTPTGREKKVIYAEV